MGLFGFHWSWGWCFGLTFGWIFIWLAGSTSYLECEFKSGWNILYLWVGLGWLRLRLVLELMFSIVQVYLRIYWCWVWMVHKLIRVWDQRRLTVGLMGMWLCIWLIIMTLCGSSHKFKSDLPKAEISDGRSVAKYLIPPEF